MNPEWKTPSEGQGLEGQGLEGKGWGHPATSMWRAPLSTTWGQPPGRRILLQLGIGLLTNPFVFPAQRPG